MMTEASDKYKHMNHYHELTEDHSLVNLSGEDFVANNAAIPLLTALSDLGLRTRTHHVDDSGGFVSVLVDENVSVEIRQVSENHSSRDRYNGQVEVLILWRKI